MKPLKEHILEGILDIENNINVDTADMTKDVIKEFLKENYNIVGSYIIKYIKRNVISKFIIDVKGDVKVKNKNITSLTNGLFEFGVVSRHFDCFQCNSLRTLEGAPKEVGRNFDCFQCNSLRTLEGAPKEVGRDFDCFQCNSLRTLEGAPKEVGRDFYCDECKSLTTLEGAPKEVYGDFYCSGCKSLKTLEGAPESCRGFYCNNCGVKFTEDDVRKYTKVKGDIYIHKTY